MCFFVWKFSIFGGNFFFNFSHLSLHDEPDGECDVRSGLSGLTVEGSHHDLRWRLESDDNDEVHYSWRGAGGGREMEERAVAA